MMSLRGSRPRWQAVIFAAARLAGVYTLLAIPLLLPWAFTGHGIPDAVTLVRYTVPVGLLFLAAFTVLAVARRAGFIVLWVLLTTLWAKFLKVVDVGSEVLVAFVFWSSLAIPLALLATLGAPSRLLLPLGSWKPGTQTLLISLWGALLIPAIAFLFLPVFELHPLREAAVDRIASRMAWVFWAPTPVIIAALAIAHVWAGTAHARVVSDAA